MNPTIQFRRIIEQATQYEKNLTLKERIEKGRRAFFGDMEYPIFDEEYRAEFETHLIRRFYTNNVGFETAELFKFELETWLMINMPRYNLLFESERKKFDPFITTDIQTTYEKKKDSNGEVKSVAKDDGSNTAKEKNDFTSVSGGSGTSDTTVNNKTDSNSKSNGENTSSTIDSAFNRDISTDTPQDRLTITANDGTGVIEYASKIDETKNTARSDVNGGVNNNVTGTQTDNGNSKTSTENHENATNNETKELEKTNKNVKDINQTNANNQLENFIQHRYGKEGFQNYATIIKEYRTTLITVENLIFDDLRELFMLIYY